MDFIINSNTTRRYWKIIENQAICVKRRLRLSTLCNDGSKEDGQERSGD
jgi:hypothetical protein